MPKAIPERLFAPCGMDCLVCYAHLRARKSCEGCLGPEDAKPGHCRACAIKDCARDKGWKRCFECAGFPCRRIRRLDASYRSRYGASLVESGEFAKREGLDRLMVADRARWLCPSCGGVICLHSGVCSECGAGLGPDAAGGNT